MRRRGRRRMPKQGPKRTESRRATKGRERIKGVNVGKSDPIYD